MNIFQSLLQLPYSLFGQQPQEEEQDQQEMPNTSHFKPHIDVETKREKDPVFATGNSSGVYVWVGSRHGENDNLLAPCDVDPVKYNKNKLKSKKATKKKVNQFTQRNILCLKTVIQNRRSDTIYIYPQMVRLRAATPIRNKKGGFDIDDDKIRLLSVFEAWKGVEILDVNNKKPSSEQKLIDQGRMVIDNEDGDDMHIITLEPGDFITVYLKYKISEERGIDQEPMALTLCQMLGVPFSSGYGDLQSISAWFNPPKIEQHYDLWCKKGPKANNHQYEGTPKARQDPSDTINDAVEAITRHIFDSILQQPDGERKMRQAVSLMKKAGHSDDFIRHFAGEKYLHPIK